VCRALEHREPGFRGPSTSPTAQQPEHLYGVLGASDIRISDDEQGWRLDRPDVFKKPVLDLPTYSFTLAVGVGKFPWFATIFACSSWNP
jgi:hypothetical protein